MDKKTLRYIVEHNFFPTELYKSPENMIGALTHKKGELIWKMYDVVAASEEAVNPYKTQDFEVNLYRASETLFMIQIDMPEPELQPECVRVFVMFREEFKEIHYFTVEYGGQGKYFLCRWTPKREHENFGTLANDERTQIEKIISIMES